MRKLLTLFIVMLALSASAYAEGTAKFSIVGGGTGTFPWVSSEPSTFSYSSKVSYAGGALLDFPFTSGSTLALGALYMDRAFSDGVNSVHAKAINLSALLRSWWGRFSLGAGVFDSIGTSLSENGTSSSYSAYGIKSNDWGAVGAAALDLKPILFEARYMIDPESIAVGGNLKFRFQNVVVLLGYEF